jgi:hypothetical protein
MTTSTGVTRAQLRKEITPKEPSPTLRTTLPRLSLGEVTNSLSSMVGARQSSPSKVRPNPTSDLHTDE